MATRLENQNNPAAFEEELSAASATDGQALAEVAELERMHALREEVNRERQQSRLRELVKDKAKQEAGKVAKKAAVTMGRRLAMYFTESLLGAAVGSVGLWVIGLLLALLLVVVIFIGMAYYTCTGSGAVGAVARGAAVLTGFINNQDGICAALDFPAASSLPSEEVPKAEAPPADPGTGLVAITGVPVDQQASDRRVRVCMLPLIQNIYKEAQKVGINFVITSAYRPGAVVAGTDNYSAHGRGEAVDLAIRPTGTWADPAFRTKVNRLVAIAREEGFNTPRGDTINEYVDTRYGATGGHVHIEFNRAATGGSYCDTNT